MKRQLTYLSILCMAIFTILSLTPGQALALTPVDTELSLLVDVSGSISTSDFTLQRNGYAAAFQSDAVKQAINSGPLGVIAVNLIYWGQDKQVEAVQWTLVGNGGISADAFAALIAATSDPSTGTGWTLTDISEAIDATVLGSTENSVVGINQNDYAGSRLVIDVSGDGYDNDNNDESDRHPNADSEDARDAALAAGIDAINGLVIGNSTIVFNRYRDEVIGGTDAFLLQVASFSEITPGLITKISAEITTDDPVVPEPATMALLGFGLFGLAGIKRRKQL